MDDDTKVGRKLSEFLLTATTETECSMEENNQNSNDKYFRYLDQLRESGETNMWGAAEYLERTFSELTCDHKRSREILFSWMRYTEKRHAEMEAAE